MLASDMSILNDNIFDIYGIQEWIQSPSSLSRFIKLFSSMNQCNNIVYAYDKQSYMLLIPWVLLAWVYFNTNMN